MRAVRLLSMTLVLCTLMPASQAGAQDWGPWEPPTARKSPQEQEKGPLERVIRQFQKYISPVDGPRCSMYPTCSAYALQAIRKHGPLLGTFIFVDRLYHEGDPLERQQQIISNGYTRYHDPLKKNTFWLESD